MLARDLHLPSGRFRGGVDVKKPKTDVMVGVVEATIRILMDHGFTRDEALQLMLSQIAVQVSPEIMRLGVILSENHHEDFAKAEWRGGKTMFNKKLVLSNTLWDRYKDHDQSAITAQYQPLGQFLVCCPEVISVVISPSSNRSHMVMLASAAPCTKIVLA